MTFDQFMFFCAGCAMAAAFGALICSTCNLVSVSKAVSGSRTIALSFPPTTVARIKELEAELNMDTVEVLQHSLRLLSFVQTKRQEGYNTVTFTFEEEK